MIADTKNGRRPRATPDATALQGRHTPPIGGWIIGRTAISVQPMNLSQPAPVVGTRRRGKEHGEPEGYLGTAWTIAEAAGWRHLAGEAGPS